MKNSFINLLCMCFLVTAGAAEDRSKMKTEAFLDLSRKAMIGDSWFKMKGNINTRPKTGKRARYPFVLSVLMREDSLIVRTKLKDDAIKVEYKFGDLHQTKILESSDKKLYDQLQLRPGDFSLSFMYWDLMKEYSSESLGLARIKCRVFLLADPDKDEYAKVWISEKYLGPVKVMWKTGSLDFDKPDRILQFEGFTKKNNRSMPKEAYFKNPYGDMQIKFNEHDGDYGLSYPKDLFKF
ncbi:hypothetical protein PQO03_16915 [Lentisphaera profundi]|uniref:Outer membrane lipoprotein-sorting protein n=1 Tax=Lentisphaera profundi TaxID=1658616 RepID=A0ABY7VXK4_9BACT|nr:hypothetical protein [Lentisphaera profundi]WDE97511.1 hypothetical protein PQO03_16915 [Lentisphaera profundi]